MKKEKSKAALRRLDRSVMIVTLLFVLAVIVCIVLSAGKLDIYLPREVSASTFVPESDIVDVLADAEDDRHLIVKANSKGKCFIENTDDNTTIAFICVKVLPGNIVYNMDNGDFSGWQVLVILFEAYIFITAVILFAAFVIRVRTELYSYTTLFFGGITLFMLTASIALLLRILPLSGTPYMLSMTYIYSLIRTGGWAFMFFTMPFVLLFVIVLFVSNISLIRHEGRSFVNILGILMGLCLLGGYVVYLFIDRLFASGSEQQMRIYMTVQSVFSYGFVYLEAMLLSASLCGLIAAKKKPTYDKTHAIILGCAIDKDGRPLPLLRGRIDRALSFAKEQQEKTGKEIVFVPSGGKGSDEIMAEAESMRDYLISQGVDSGRILTENKSVNTRENMRFSSKLISADSESPEILFSTSDYHVLRSGIISRNEGLEAEGTGCRTKWYFWPNAFIREFIGLIASEWKKHLFWMISLVLFLGEVSMLIPL